MSVLANFTGSWYGDGKFVTHKRQGDCFEVFFELKDGSSEFELVTGGYNCSQLSAEYPNSIFEKQNGALLSEGKIVGAYSDNMITIFDKENEFSLTFSKDDDKSAMNVKEEWGNNINYLIIKSYLKND